MFGQFLLQRGAGTAGNCVPGRWIDEADRRARRQRQSARQPSTGSWATATSSGGASTVPIAATARSASSCVVMPEQDAVFVMTGGYNDMQGR